MKIIKISLAGILLATVMGAAQGVYAADVETKTIEHQAIEAEISSSILPRTVQLIKALASANANEGMRALGGNLMEMYELLVGCDRDTITAALDILDKLSNITPDSDTPMIEKMTAAKNELKHCGEYQTWLKVTVGVTAGALLFIAIDAYGPKVLRTWWENRKGGKGPGDDDKPDQGPGGSKKPTQKSDDTAETNVSATEEDVIGAVEEVEAEAVRQREAEAARQKEEAEAEAVRQRDVEVAARQKEAEAEAARQRAAEATRQAAERQRDAEAVRQRDAEVAARQRRAADEQRAADAAERQRAADRLREEQAAARQRAAEAAERQRAAAEAARPTVVETPAQIQTTPRGGMLSGLAGNPLFTARQQRSEGNHTTQGQGRGAADSGNVGQMGFGGAGAAAQRQAYLNAKGAGGGGAK